MAVSNNPAEILCAVVEYREACDAVEPAWEAFARLYAVAPETPQRREARHRYTDATQRVKAARKRLLEAALDGRSEVPR